MGSKRAKLQFKLIANTYHRSDTIEVEFLPDLADMHIDGAIAHNYFGASNLVQYFVA